MALEIKLHLCHTVSRADSIVKHDEADISLISSMLHAVSRGVQTIRILSDDTDVFILLMCWCHKANVTCPIQIEKWDGKVLIINDIVSRLGGTCSGLLGMHALSGCDTVSYLNGKGRVSALKVLNQNNLTGLASVLGEPSTWHFTPRRRAIQSILQDMTFFESERIHLLSNPFHQQRTTWLFMSREPISKCCFGRLRTSQIHLL